MDTSTVRVRRVSFELSLVQYGVTTDGIVLAERGIRFQEYDVMLNSRLPRCNIWDSGEH